jgi:KH/beta-lactamase-domain protein
MEILEKVKSLLPSDSITRVELEGSEVIAYTNDREFFKTHEDTVRKVVSQVKKRIEMRPEKNLNMDQEETKKLIRNLVPEEAKIQDIYFEPERSLVIIAAEKPGLVIGRGGETFRKIRADTFWIPRIERVPPIKSDIVMGIRKYIHEEVDYRKKFLNRTGENIFKTRPVGRDWIRIVGLGGWREVGRSCTFIETPKSKVMIDCGVKAGATGSEVYPILNTPEFSYNDVDAIIISHSHMDHVGFVPALYEYGYDGPMYMTTPSLDLATLLWFDYVDVMQKGITRPLFTARGIKEAVRHTITLDYGEVCDVAPDIRLTFQPSGHILGSAFPHLHIGEGLHNIVYALDQKFARTMMLDPSHTNFPRAETLLIESTYGGRNNIFPPRLETERMFMEVVNRTMERGGIVLIPSFAVERAQEAMAILIEYGFQYPIYLDGMIWDANGIFSAYPEYMSRSMQRKIYSGQDPFTSPLMKRISSRVEREKVWTDRPCVIISTSGMLTGGPVLEHMKNLGDDPRNTLMFIGYQSEGSLGRRIQNGWREIPISVGDGRTAVQKLEMEVATIEGLSGHSDRKQLMAFLNRLNCTPERVICVHGESSRAQEFARDVSRYFRVDAFAPRNLDAIRLR